MRKITENNKIVIKAQKMTDVEKEAEKVIDMIKETVTEEAEKGKEEAVVRLGGEKLTRLI